MLSEQQTSLPVFLLKVINMWALKAKFIESSAWQQFLWGCSDWCLTYDKTFYSWIIVLHWFKVLQATFSKLLEGRLKTLLLSNTIYIDSVFCLRFIHIFFIVRVGIESVAGSALAHCLTKLKASYKSLIVIKNKCLVRHITSLYTAEIWLILLSRDVSPRY